MRENSAPGSEAARDKWFVQKKSQLQEKVLPRQRSCPGQVVCSKKSPDFEKKFCPRQRSCLGQVVCSKQSPNFEKKFCPRQRSCPGQVVCSKKSPNFEKKFCPRQRSCPGQAVCSEKSSNFEKKSATGSEAARDKWFVQKTIVFKKKLPQAAKLHGTSGLFEKNEKQFCPRQRSCPGQVACSKKSYFEKKFCPRQRTCLGQVACLKNRKL